MSQSLYTALCQQWFHLPVFVQNWYLDAVCDDGEWNAAIVEEEGRVAAVLPYFLKQKGPFRYITMPPFVKYMGPYFHPDYGELKHEHRLMEALIHQLPACDSFKQNFHPGLSNWLPFYWCGYRQSTRYTYQFDPIDPEFILAGVNRNVRRNLNKAKEQVEVLTGGDPGRFYQINRRSFERQGLSIPYTFEQFRRQDEALAGHHSREIFFAVDPSGKVHSAAYLIWDKQAAYYHLSGDENAGRESGAGLLLIWEAICYTRERLGLQRFDFEGSMMRPVEAIRRQFGARQQPYSMVWKYDSRLMELADLARGKIPG